MNRRTEIRHPCDYLKEVYQLFLHVYSGQHSPRSVVCVTHGTETPAAHDSEPALVRYNFGKGALHSVDLLLYYLNDLLNNLKGGRCGQVVFHFDIDNDHSDAPVLAPVVIFLQFEVRSL